MSKPRGAALNQRRSRDWDAYSAAHARIRTEVLRPLRSDIQRKVSEVVTEWILPLDRRKRIGDAIDRKDVAAKSIARKLGAKVEEGLSGLRQEVERALKSAVADLGTSVTRARIDFERTDVADTDEPDLDVLQGRWEEAIEATIGDTSTRLESFADQMGSLIVAIHRGETLDQTTDAIQYIALHIDTLAVEGKLYIGDVGVPLEKARQFPRGGAAAVVGSFSSQ